MKNLAPYVLAAALITASAWARPSTAEARATRVEIRVDETGFHPSHVRVRAGRPFVLVVTRTSDASCGRQIVFPALGIRRELPLNVAVTIRWTPAAPGDIAFTCGMAMYRGSIIAE